MQRHPTSAEPAAAPTHTLIIRSDRALTLAARTDDEARGRLWAELVTSRPSSEPQSGRFSPPWRPW
jgi:hypothetical protein